MWINYAIVALISMISFSIITKKALTTKDDNDPIAYSSWLFIIVATLSLAILLITGEYKVSGIENLFNPKLLIWLIPNVLLYTFAPSIYYKAFKYVALSHISIIMSSVGIFALILGAILGTEKLTLLKLGGGLLIITAVTLVTYTKKGTGKEDSTKLLILGAVIYALAAITDEKIVNSGLLSNLTFQALNFGIPAITLLIWNHTPAKEISKVIKSKSSRTYLLVNGIIFFINFYAIYKAYSLNATPSQMNLISAVETPLVTLFAAMFLNERENLWKKLFGAVLCGIGIYMLVM